MWERLDDAIAWLVARGAPVVWEETGNPRTVGKRFDPRGLVEALAGDVVLGADGRVDGPLILCTGGFAASSELVDAVRRAGGAAAAAREPVVGGRRSLRSALERGAALTAGMADFYGRNMPDAAWDETELVSLSQLYGRFARIFDEDGVEFFARDEVSWSETNVVAATARRPGAKAYYVLDEAALA